MTDSNALSTDNKTVPATGSVRLLYTPVEAAEALGISRSTLYVLLASGEIPSVRIGTSRRIRSTALDGYVDSLGPSGGSQPDGRMNPSRSPGSPGDAADGIESTREEGA
jgi:excisionase family DNA binding protein